MKAKPWALLSVSNKTGIEDCARRLVALGWRIISSGGTAKKLKEAGVPVRDVAKLVGGGSILGHRVVTLSREVHAGLLANVDKQEDMKELKKLGIPVISMVICDFYPLEKTISEAGATPESVAEGTDIGGPCMVRSAAKGLRIVACTLQDREVILRELEETGAVSKETRQRLRARAEFEVAKYVLASARYHGNGQFEGLMGELVQELAYGENKQKPARLYSTGSKDPLALENFHVVEGSTPSYINVTDYDREITTLTHVVNYIGKRGIIPCVCLVVKHGNCCGAGIDMDNPAQAVLNAVTGDTTAAMGGVVMCNFKLTKDLAGLMVHAGMEGKTQKFDGVVAPEIEEGVGEFLERVKGKCRMVVNPHLASRDLKMDSSLQCRPVRGGFLTQPRDNYVPVLDDSTLVAGARDRDKELDLLLAGAIARTGNSNTITVVKNRKLLGNGVGQQDRVGAAMVALLRAKKAGNGGELEDSVAWSDSFFPYPDGPKVLTDGGVKTIFSTSGSKAPGGGDPATIQHCKDAGANLHMLDDGCGARGFAVH
ncbi:MAG: hypothetical protein NTW11_02555 [Candidatus Staskawiczbacteria bacterium]|nr:hypothetical protein [Candidatus Staskawiczbacteria bacterium]